MQPRQPRGPPPAHLLAGGGGFGGGGKGNGGKSGAATLTLELDDDGREALAQVARLVAHAAKARRRRARSALMLRFRPVRKQKFVSVYVLIWSLKRMGVRL